MKGQSRIFFLLITIALILSAAGCASGTPPKQLPTPGPAATSFPVGTFLRQGEDRLIGGRWVEYKADDSYVYNDPNAGATGKYTVTGDQVLFVDSYCGDVKGIYTWALDGEKLAFKLLDDDCAARSEVLSNSSWERK